MSRPTPSTCVAIPANTLAPSRTVREGSTAGQFGELDLVELLHYLHLYMVPSAVRTNFVSGLVAGSASYVLRGLWQRRPYVDCTDWEVSVVCANSSGADAATIKFEMASDSSNVEISVPAGQALTDSPVTGRVTYDATQTLDTIEMWVKNGATGALTVHAVEIRPYLGSIAAGRTTAGLTPLDTAEVGADKPLTTYARRMLQHGLEVLRKTRLGSFIGWSEDIGRASASAWESTSASYELMHRQPITIPRGCTELEWALTGYVAAGGTGAAKVEVVGVDTGGTHAREVSLGTTWTSPYTAAQYSHEDGGSGTIDVAENQSVELRVSLKGDGTQKAFIMGLSVWPKDAS